MKALFPDAPEDLAALGDEALTDLLASFQDVSRRLKAGEIDLDAHYGEDVSRADASADAMSQWRAAAEKVQEIRAVITERKEAEEAFADEAENLDAAFGEPEAEAAVEPEALAAENEDEEDDEDEGEKVDEPEAEASVEEPETVVAAADPPKARPVLYPAVPRSARADTGVEGEPKRAVLVAASGLTDTRPGTELDRLSLADTMIQVARRRGAPKKHRGGNEERILVASADLPFPEDRTLRAGDHQGNSEKIRAIGSPFFGAREMETLVASGGLCAPATPFYDIPDVSTTARPVRDFLPGFMADRGAVSVPSVSTIGDITSAITVIEEADDALGGTFATKSCQDLTCAEWTDVAVGSISHCREYGNLGSRAWPEGIAHENAITMAAWARTAEGRLLDRLDALSVNVTRAAVYGASSTLIYALQLSRVGIISRLRMDPRTRFQVLLPFWVAEMFSLDLVNSQYGRFDTPAEQVGALLSRFGFSVGWHLDEGIDGAADAEVFEAQEAGAQVDWPGTTAIARLFPAGEFLYLDGGSLELGLVRDSTLNSTNDYQMFGESWENVARIGPADAAHRIAITVCPDGTVAAPDTSAFTCSAS